MKDLDFAAEKAEWKAEKEEFRKEKADWKEEKSDLKKEISDLRKSLADAHSRIMDLTSGRRLLVSDSSAVPSTSGSRSSSRASKRTAPTRSPTRSPIRSPVPSTSASTSSGPPAKKNRRPHHPPGNGPRTPPASPGSPDVEVILHDGPGTQCVACGAFWKKEDKSGKKNLPRHWLRKHHKDFKGTRWFTTETQLDKLPAERRLEVRYLRCFRGVNWKWTGLVKPLDYNVKGERPLPKDDSAEVANDVQESEFQPDFHEESETDVDEQEALEDVLRNAYVSDLSGSDSSEDSDGDEPVAVPDF